MPVEEFKTVLSKCDDASLQLLVKAAKFEGDKVPKDNKDDQIQALVAHALATGTNSFVQSMNKKMIGKAIEEAKVKSESKKLAEMRKLLLDTIASTSLEKVLKLYSKATLKEFVEMLDFETDATNEDELSADISDEVLLLGARTLFDKLQVANLKEVCKGLKLKTTNKQRKQDLMDTILNEAFPGILPAASDVTPPTSPKKSTSKKAKKEKKDSKSDAEGDKAEASTSDSEKKKKKKKKSKKKSESKQRSKEEILASRKPLKKGITYDEVFQDYWVEELKDFCRENQLACSGNKKQIIKVILNYFEDPENKGYHAKKRKRKSSGTKKKSSKKDKSESGDDAKPKKKKQKTDTKDAAASDSAAATGSDSAATSSSTDTPKA